MASSASLEGMMQKMVTVTRVAVFGWPPQMSFQPLPEEIRQKLSKLENVSVQELIVVRVQGEVYTKNGHAIKADIHVDFPMTDSDEITEAERTSEQLAQALYEVLVARAEFEVLQPDTVLC